MSDGSYTNLSLKVLLAALLALIAALLVVFGTIKFLSTAPHGAPTHGTLTEDEKLRILAALEASSTASSTNSRATLTSLHASSSNLLTETQKLDILHSLQQR